MKKTFLILLGFLLTYQSLFAQQQQCLITNAFADLTQWTQVGAGKVSVNNTGIHFNDAADRTEDRVWRPAPKLSNTAAWRIQFEFNPTKQSNASHNLIAYTSTNQDVQYTAWGVNSVLDACFVNYFTPYVSPLPPSISIGAKQGALGFNSGTSISLPSLNVTYFMLFERLNGRTLRLSVFSDAARTIAVGTPILCTIPCNLGTIDPLGNGGLQFLQSGTNWPGGNTRFLSADINNLSLCVGSLDLSNPTVNASLPLPSVNDVTICTGNSASLNATNGDYSLRYNWYNVSTGGSPISTNYYFYTPVFSTAGTYTYYVSYITPCGEMSSRKAVTVTVNPMPAQATITGNASVCVGQIGELVSSNLNGVWSSADPTIATIKQTGIVRGIAAGTTTIYNTVTSGACSSIASFSITVNDVLTFQITGPSPLCPSTSGNQYIVSPSVVGADYTWNIQNAPSVGVNFPVNGSNTSLLTTPSAGTIAGGQFILRCQGKNACGLSQMVTKMITMSTNVPPQPNVSCSGSTTDNSCVNLTVSNNVGYGIVWTNASTGAVLGTGTSIVRPLSTTVYCTYTSGSGCTSRTAYSPAVVCTYSARTAEPTSELKSSLKLYPNPSDGEFTFETSGYNGRAQVLNMLGNVVQEFELTETQKVYHVNIKNQAKSQYLLRLTGGPESQTNMFVTQ